MDVIQAEEQALTARALRGMAKDSRGVWSSGQRPDSPGFAQGGVIAFDVRAPSPAGSPKMAARGGIGVPLWLHARTSPFKRILACSALGRGVTAARC